MRSPTLFSSENQDPPDSSLFTLQIKVSGKSRYLQRDFKCPEARFGPSLLQLLWMVPLEHNAVIWKTATAIVQSRTKTLEVFIDFMGDQKSHYLLYLLYHNDFLRNLHYSRIHSCFPCTMIDSFHHFHMESFHIDSERKVYEKDQNFCCP